MNFRPKRSAYLIGIGVVALVVGQVVYTAGQQQAIVSSLSRYGGGGNSMGVGVVISLVGLSFLVTGLVNLARSVDYLAAREHARSVIASTTPGAASAEASEPGRRVGAIPDENVHRVSQGGTTIIERIDDID